MGIAAWGWDRNWVRQGRLTASSQVGELGVGNLQSDHGGAWAGWQTAGTSASLRVEMPQAVPWRVMLLARSNLTPAATVRWRVGGARMLDPVVVMAIDSAAGALLGSNTIRVENVAPPPGAVSAVAYRNSATSSAFVRVLPGTVTPGVPYDVVVRIRRRPGATSTVGNAISISHPGPTGALIRTNLAMASLPQGTAWSTIRRRFVLGQSGACMIYIAADTGAFEFELASAVLEPGAEYDSGVISAGVVLGIGQSAHVLPAEVQGQIAFCEISDLSNPDGFLNIALSYQGPVVQTALNIGWGGGHGRSQGGADVRTRGGTEYPRLDWTARTRDIEHNGVLDTEVWPLVMALDAYARRGGNVLLLPNPGSPYLAQEAIFGRLRTTALLTTPLNTEDRVAWRATIEERL